MADLLKEDLNVDVELVKGHSGIFEVAVNGEVVAKKTLMGFPDDEHILQTVRLATSK